MASHVIDHWNPEDKSFWDRNGHSIATRNLWLSIPALTLAFAVWMVWSVVVVNLPNVGFKYSTNQLFWLAALPALCGATLRIFYSFAVPIFGGRRWTAISTASLMLPAVGIGFAVQNPATPYEVMVLLALLCGFGGGNFASSMANISFFYPKAQKGYALGMNAGLGNLGVSLVQLVVPLVITAGVFGIMAVAGYTTRTDLTKLGSILMIGLIGIVLASLVNMFLKSDTMSYVVSIISVVVFTGLTAYDVQKLKRMGEVVASGTEAAQKMALMGALSLYLDFINLFLSLLRLFGRRD